MGVNGEALQLHAVYCYTVLASHVVLGMSLSAGANSLLAGMWMRLITHLILSDELVWVLASCNRIVGSETKLIRCYKSAECPPNNDIHCP